MGLFDFIGGMIQQANTDAREAQMEAERLDARQICRELGRMSSTNLFKIAGYKTVLQSRCRNMNDRELKNIFNEMYCSKNIHACNAIKQIIEERGLN